MKNGSVFKSGTMWGGFFLMFFAVASIHSLNAGSANEAEERAEFGKTGSMTIPLETGGEFDVYRVINRVLCSNRYPTNLSACELQVPTANVDWVDYSERKFRAVYIAVCVSASFRNTLRIYNSSDPGIMFPVLCNISGDQWFGNGTASDPYIIIGYGPPAMSGKNFHWSLLSDAGQFGGAQNIWDSDKRRNFDAMEHMLTFHLGDLSGKTVVIFEDGMKSNHTFTDPYLIVWEDFEKKFSDNDYNDIIFLVDRVAPNCLRTQLVPNHLFGSNYH